jgi:hypothetical protein
MTVDWLRHKTDPPSRQRGRPPMDKTVNCQTVNKHLVMSPRRGSTPRQTDWLTVSRNVTLTLKADCSACHLLVSCSAYSLTMKMEATCSSETLVNFQRTGRRYILEDNNTLHNQWYENLKPFILRKDIPDTVDDDGVIQTAYVVHMRK